MCVCVCMCTVEHIHLIECVIEDLWMGTCVCEVCMQVCVSGSYTPEVSGIFFFLVWVTHQWLATSPCRSLTMSCMELRSSSRTISVLPGEQSETSSPP